MPIQHYLPASYIGRFSLKTSGRWRDRPLWVHRVKGSPYLTKAESVGSQRDLYEWQEATDAPVDPIWQYEARLPQALDALSDDATPLDARIWAQVLVPFVSSLFIRGLDFNKRYESRRPGLSGPPTDPSDEPLPLLWHDNTLMARVVEWQRLLAPVMAAKWTVVHGTAPLLATNDVGRFILPTSPPRAPLAYSYAIPLDSRTFLVLEPCSVRRIVDWNGTRWTASIAHRPAPDYVLKSVKRMSQAGALHEVYGPTRESVDFDEADFESRVGPLEPSLLFPGGSGTLLVPYMEDYFKILTVVELTLDDFAAWDGSPDPEAVMRSWTTPIQGFVDLPPFPGGVASLKVVLPSSDRVTGGSVYLDLTRFTEDEVKNCSVESPLKPKREPSETLRKLTEMDIARWRSAS